MNTSEANAKGTVAVGDADPVPTPRPPMMRGRTWWKGLSFTNISVIYVEIALIVIFAFWAPDTFFTWTTAKSVLAGSAVPGLMALAVVVPLSARLFDLSIGSAMGLANMLVAWLLVVHHWGVVAAVVATVVAGVGMGLLNWGIIVGARIDSFIGTLASGSLFATPGSIMSDQSSTGVQLNGSFSKIATVSLFGFGLPVYLMLLVALGLWYFQNYTVTGRRAYALGYNERAAELVGVRIKRLKLVCLLFAGIVAGVAGIVLASSVQSGSPNIGPPYLLNAYAAAFLGATQFGGRFNAWGTVLAVVLLNTGVNGIYLVGGAPWVQSMFTGLVLLLALGASSLEQAIAVRSWIRRKAAQRNDADSAAAAPGHRA